jgi:hypothetical protein
MASLERSEFVLFNGLGWQPNPSLQSTIHFQAALIETLAREAGIEPGVLDLLKKIGLTNEAELRSRLGLTDRADTGNENFVACNKHHSGTGARKCARFHRL